MKNKTDKLERKLERKLKRHYRKAAAGLSLPAVTLPASALSSALPADTLPDGKECPTVIVRPAKPNPFASAAAFTLIGLGIVSMVILFALSGNGFGSKLEPNPAGHQPSEPKTDSSDVRYAHLEWDRMKYSSDRGVEEFLAQLAEEYGDDTILNAECYNITNDLVREKTGVEIFEVDSMPDHYHRDFFGYYFQKDGKIFFSDNGISVGYVSVLPCDFDGDGNYELLFSHVIGSGVFYATIGILYPESGETKYLSDSYIYSDFIITPDDPFDGQNFTVWNWCDENLYYEVGRITSENGQPKVGIDSDPIPHPITPVDPNVTQPKPDPSNPQTPTPKPTVPEPTLPPDIAALPENVREGMDAYLQKYSEETLASACQYDKFKLIGHYGDCYVFMDSSGMRLTVIDRIIVDGYRFTYFNSFGIPVYRNGEIYELQSAYENGWLTHDQLEQINADYRAKVVGLPSVKGIEMPSAELVNEIEQAWCDQRELHTVLWDEDLRYYGAYGSGAVIYGDDWRVGAHTLRIADNDFELDGGSLWYYQDGTLTELSAAYDNGWLTADQIAEIAAYHASYPD